MRSRGAHQRAEILEDGAPVAAAAAAAAAPSQRAAPEVDIFACCRVCGLREGVQQCGRCRSVFYCGVLHQSVDWPVHRRACHAAVASAAGKPVLSLTHELLKTMTHTVEVQLLLPRERTTLAIQTPVNDGVVFTVDDLVRRVLRAVGEGRDEPLDPSGPWRMFRRHQESPLDRDDVLLMLGLANFEPLLLRQEEERFVLRLHTLSVAEMVPSEPGRFLELEGIPETALLGEVLVHLKKKFKTPKLVLLRKPGHAACIKNVRKPMWQLRHHAFLLAEYASPETFEWRLGLWDQAVSFGFRNRDPVRVALVLLLLFALMALGLYILVANLPRVPELVA